MTIHLPFANIQLKQPQPRHKQFFQSQFMEMSFEPRPLLKLPVTFKVADVPSSAIPVQNSLAVEDQTVYLKDTQGHVASFQPNQILKKTISLTVHPEFDLYYLYTFLLEPLYIINLARQGVLVLHASAMVNEKNQASIFPAWRHTGKTDLLLTLTQKGYQFLADDYCVVKDTTAYAYPKKINLFSYNLNRFPELYHQLPLTTHLRLKSAASIKSILHQMSLILSGPLAKVFYRISQLAEVSTNIKLDAKKLNIKVATSASIKSISLLQNSQQAQSIASSLSKDQAAQKLTRIIQYELNDFFKLYQMWTFANPNLKNQAIETFLQTYHQLAESLPSTRLLSLSQDKSDIDTLEWL